ncbi:MAG TPA: DNA primase [Pilimelia sp.]|nr:DNA primase [Pilimelia sp.]
MARQSPHRPNAEEPEAALGQGAPEDAAPDEAPAVLADPDEAAAPEATDRSLWADAKIDPIELALPAGVGYTLRAYRLSSDITPTDIEGRDDDDPFAARADLDEDDEDEVVILDDEFNALAGAEPPRRRARDGDEDDEDDDALADVEEPELAADEDDEDEDEDEKAVVEEVPTFLSHRGKLLLFKSPEALVSFIRSGAPHDLAQLDSWPQVAERVQLADIAATSDDSYELDLVVENLRGGHETWDLDLLIRAGEISRDLAYALRLAPVLTALSSGSPLDDLDEALRSAAGGGIGGFMGRRRLRRIGAQQASLGWRTIIGKISAAVDWRD